MIMDENDIELAEGGKCECGYRGFWRSVLEECEESIVEEFVCPKCGALKKEYVWDKWLDEG